MTSKRFALLALSLGVLGGAHAARADMHLDGTYRLHSHPDGGARPPLYGLRLDGLDGDASVDNYGNARGSIFTFDFDHVDELGRQAMMLMTVDQGGGEIHIRGTMYGGRNEGDGYDDDGLHEC